MSLRTRYHCRSCSTQEGTLTSEAVDEEMHLAVMHINKMKYIFRDIDLEETKPFLLCRNCIKLLNIAYKFLRAVYVSNSKYDKMIKTAQPESLANLCRCCLNDIDIYNKMAVNCDTQAEQNCQFARLRRCFIILTNVLDPNKLNPKDFVLCNICFHKLNTSYSLKKNVITENIKHKKLVEQHERKLEESIQNSSQIREFEHEQLVSKVKKELRESIHNSMQLHNMLESKRRLKSSIKSEKSIQKLVRILPKPTVNDKVTTIKVIENYNESNSVKSNEDQIPKESDETMETFIVHAIPDKNVFTNAVTAQEGTSNSNKELNGMNCGYCKGLSKHGLKNRLKMFKCVKCSNKYCQMNCLKLHLCRGDMFECKKCQMLFISQTRGRNHQYHCINNVFPEKNQYSDSFNFDTISRHHVITQSGEKVYRCVYCNKQFFSKSVCLIHEQFHRHK